MDLKKIKFDLTLAGSFEFFEKLIGYFVLATLARHLDKGNMGDFFFAFSFASIFSMLTQLGTGKYLIRRISEDAGNVRNHLDEVLSVRIPLSLMTFLLMNAIAWLLIPDQILIVMLTGIYVFALSLYHSFGAMFSGLRLVSYRIATGMFGQLLLVVLVVACVQLGWQLEGILLCYIIANVSLLGLTALLVRVQFGQFHVAWNRKVWSRVVIPSLVFFFITFLDLLVFKADTIMLRFLASTVAVADYEAAYKFFEVSRVVVRPTAMVFFPICAQMAVQGDWVRFTAVFRKLVFILCLLGVGIACVVILLAPILIPAVWGRLYNESIPILQVLFLAVPTLYTAFMGIFLGNALYLEHTIVRILLVSLIGNIVLNGFAIPTWGAIGAAWTTVATEVFIAMGVMWVIIARLRALRDPLATRFTEKEIATRQEPVVQYDDA